MSYTEIDCKSDDCELTFKVADGIQDSTTCPRCGTRHYYPWDSEPTWNDDNDASPSTGGGVAEASVRFEYDPLADGPDVATAEALQEIAGQLERIANSLDGE